MNSNLRALILASVVVASGFLPTIASAIQDASYTAALSAGGPQSIFTGPGTYSLSGSSTSLLNSPALIGHADGGSFVGSLESVIDYYFMVEGPGLLLVPLFASVTLDVNTSGQETGTSSATSRFTLWINDGMILNPFFEASNANPNPIGFSDQLFQIDVTPGSVGKIHLQIDATAWGVSGVAGSADAFASSFLFIDPGFLEINPGYTVIVSNGVDNKNPVVTTEPSTLLLLGSCFLGLVGMNRRRRT